jgi:hypothetical protein
MTLIQETLNRTSAMGCKRMRVGGVGESVIFRGVVLGRDPWPPNIRVHPP